MDNTLTLDGIILFPDWEIKRKYGTLAHISEAERKQIMDAPFGRFKPLVRSVEKRVSKALKKHEKQSKR